MEIEKGIEIKGPSLFLKKEKILIICDIHIGQERIMNRQGINIPLNQYKQINEFTEKILEETKPKQIIINGDLKHDFGKITNDEWDKITLFLKNLKKYSDVIIIAGNHDKVLQPITGKLKINMKKHYFLNNIYITHGDIIPENSEFAKAKTIIIGHEHPAIKLKDGNRIETYKAFIKGKYKNKTLIVMPSLNPLSEGSDILTEKFLSPFLKESKKQKTLAEFESYILDDQNNVYFFGKIKGLGKL
ncbi:metallophosphoesterase [Candidatus Woesearchaeota archaeon]|nr:metallophosphoesterase [Candidatus Woesearchaeota archaeon]